MRYQKSCVALSAFILSVLLLAPFVCAQTGEGWKWRVKIGSGAPANSWDVGEQTVYLFDDKHFAVAFDAASGREKWRYKLRPNVWARESSEVGNRLVFVESLEYNSRDRTAPDNVVALDAWSGKEVWRKEFEKNNIADFAVSGATVYLNVEDFGVAALDAATGALKWQSNACPDAIYEPFAADRKVFVECFGGRLYALNEDTGNLEWRIGKRGSAAAFASGGDDLYFNRISSRGERSIVAADKNTGREKWRLPAESYGFDKKVLGDLLVTTSLEGASLAAINRFNGETVWKLNIKSETADGGSQAIFDGFVESNNVLYFGRNDGTMFAVRTATGQIVWQNKISDDLFFLPEIIGNNSYSLVVQQNVFYLAAINLTTGKLNWRMKLYADADHLSQKNGVLFFKTDDNYLNAVAPAQVEKLVARLKTKTFGASAAIKQKDVQYSGMGGTVGGTNFVNIFSDVKAEIVGDKAFVTVTRGMRDSGDGGLYTVDTNTGKQKLLAATPSIVQLSKPVVRGGTAYFTATEPNSRKHLLYALNADSGKKLWLIERAGRRFAPPSVSDKYVYYSVADTGKLQVFGLDGKTVVELDTGDSTFDPAVIENDTIYFVAEKTNLKAYDLLKREIKWEKKFPAGLGNPVLNANSILIGSDDEHLYAIDKQTGDALWKYDAEGALPTNARIAAQVSGNTIYYVSEAYDRKLLQAIDLQTNKMMWERNVPSAEFVFNDRFVFTAEMSRVFDAETGKSSRGANLHDFKKLSLAAVSPENLLLVHGASGDYKPLQLTAVNWQAPDKVLWKIDFGQQP